MTEIMSGENKLYLSQKETSRAIEHYLNTIVFKNQVKVIKVKKESKATDSGNEDGFIIVLGPADAGK